VEQSAGTKKGLMAQIQHYWHAFLKWKWSALFVFAACLGGMTLYTLTLTPVYTSVGSVWIEEDTKILPFQEIQSAGVGANMQSHARLLQSRALATSVVEKLKLNE
jgi:uncharacterized protein involved in exopolysaccharide biosynthesis